MTESKQSLLMGNEAIARGLVEAGCSVAAAYPGTPATEAMTALIGMQPQANPALHVEWSLNEKIALEVALAASYTGKRSVGIADQINVQKIIYGSERSSVSMRQKISHLFGGAELFDITGLTELYGPGTGIECAHHDCIHYWADYYIVEIVDPETLQPVPAGEWGEMVVTTLCKEAAPLLRYRTRDITRLIPGRCSCGSVLPRHSRILGRTDDTFIFRGVNIYPSSVDSIISVIGEFGSEYQIHLSRDADSGRDSLKLIVERSQQSDCGNDARLIRDLIQQVKKQLLVHPRSSWFLTAARLVRWAKADASSMRSSLVPSFDPSGWLV